MLHEQDSQWLAYSKIPYRTVLPPLPTMSCAMHPQAWVWAPLGLFPATAKADEVLYPCLNIDKNGESNTADWRMHSNLCFDVSEVEMGLEVVDPVKGGHNERFGRFRL